MDTSSTFVDRIKTKHNVTSDYAVAALLGVHRSAMSKHRHGQRDAWDDVIGLRIADLLEIDPAYVLACLSAERTKRPDVAKVWKKVAGGFVALILAVLFLGSPQPVQASSTCTGYVLCEVRYRRVLAWLLGALLGVFSLSATAADPWSRADVTREAVYQALAVVDWGQTLDIENHPGLYETNFILGKHPSRARINAYFLTTGALHFAATHYLPREWRPVFQYVSIGIEVGAVSNNYKLGVKLAF